MKDAINTIALVAAVVLPFWNIPLIVRIVKRRSSNDISLYWAIGVWSCFVLMAPQAFVSKDLVWKIFNIVNFILFSTVLIFVLAYRNKKPRN
ncbi:MAG: hypothetical protein KBB01_04710 [Candidatus Omnitrophica bacterium]|nr:hypothetical protein [Candidatus Omnitrophota bacterium]